MAKPKEQLCGLGWGESCLPLAEGSRAEVLARRFALARRSFRVQLSGAGSHLLLAVWLVVRSVSWLPALSAVTAEHRQSNSRADFERLARALRAAVERSDDVKCFAFR